MGRARRLDAAVTRRYIATMQIRPTFESRTLPGGLSAAAPPPGSPFLEDGFAGSVPMPEFAPPVLAGAPAAAPRFDPRRTLVVMAGFGLLGVLALAGPVYAEESSRPAATAAVTSAELAEARRYGLSEKTAQQLAAHPEVADILRDLPTDIASAYRRMTPAQKRVNYQELTGTTRVGLISVNNRKAFIEGKVLGVDALPRAHDNIDKRVDAGDLTPKEGEELKANLTRLSRLTPRQRQAIADVVIWEGPGR